MVKLWDQGVYILNSREIIDDENKLKAMGQYMEKSQAAQNTIAYGILQSHNTSGDEDKLRIKFDAMASHDITYVGIIQTARASGLESFPLPYVLTNCHNSLCAVGGTINEDDHVFGLTAAQRFGGIYVPAHQAVIHQYMREMMSGGGKMILGSDSHTRYGALGTMAIGEGGGELAKQLLGKTYDINMPDVVAVYLTGKPQKGVGPQDIALAIIGAVFERGYVKNKVMEFIGDGIANLNVEYRNGIDVMTTETTCLTSIWETDGQTKEYYAAHFRLEDYKEMKAGAVAYYSGMVYVDMSRVKPMIAMPFHPSNVYTIEEVNENPQDILAKVEKEANAQLDDPHSGLRLQDKIRHGRLVVEQGVIAGCAGGTYDNICDAADILRGHSIGAGEFSLSVYPSSQPTFMALLENGVMGSLMATGATVRSAFCGPCFGAGDVPSNASLSVRHTTRNFPNREGSKPSTGQLAAVALMDARSVAATALNKGILTPATDIDVAYTKPQYYFKKEVYDNRVYNGWGRPDYNAQLRFGPGITDWPEMPPLGDNLLLKAVSVIRDPVTTTDELIPSGETSSYRSNPLGLAEFTLSRKDPGYVGRAKAVNQLERTRLSGGDPLKESPELANVFPIIQKSFSKAEMANTAVGSVIYAVKPGDGSAREQAASCQKVLGGYANIAREYATKRYRSNLINWGIMPFVYDGECPVDVGDYLFVPGVRDILQQGGRSFKAYRIRQEECMELTLSVSDLTEDEAAILLSGCLINYYKVKS